MLGLVYPYHFLDHTYRFASRVKDVEGKAVAQAKLIAIDTDGLQAGIATTDDFGYYCIDNLPPGIYTARLDSSQPEIRIELTDNYLFEQDLVQ